jgi:outer membrane protein OmpA-like peptidoglycan-associated protein
MKANTKEDMKASFSRRVASAAPAALQAVTIGAGLLLCACASTPRTDPALEQARADVQMLQSDPVAMQSAGKPLQDARDALAAAEAAAQQKRPVEEVDHLAYLASRRAAIGEAVVAETRAHNELAQAQARRDQVLLQAREREAAAAREQTRDVQASAQVQIDASKAQADAAKAEAEATRKALEDLQAKQTERGMVLSLGSNVLFDTNRAELKPGASESLDRVAQFLQQHPNMKVRIEGHTDSTGTDSYNMELSQRRADAVAHALESRGADAANIVAVGRGSELPVASNDTAAGRQQNRRVELVFSDGGHQLAERTQPSTGG